MRHRVFGSLLLFLLLAGSAAAEEYWLDPAVGSDSVYFRSTAKLEFIEGETGDLVGGFTFDPENPTGPVSGILRVDLRTLRTGIETRDGHMRDNHLNTDEYPYAYFELTGVKGMPPTLQPDSTYKVLGLGYFYIRGVKRALTADLELRVAQGRVDATAGFRIQLDDYEIPRPKALFLKLAETIEVEVILSGYNNLPPTSVTLPDWPEKD